MDHVREFDSVTNEEHRHVVSDDIEVTLSGVKLDGETTGITESFRAATLVDDGGEADNKRSLDAGSAEEIGASEMGDIVGDFKKAFGTDSSGMNHSFWDPFSVESSNLLHQSVVLQQDWTCKKW